MKLFCLGIFLLFAGIDIPGFTLRKEQWTIVVESTRGNVSKTQMIRLMDHEAESRLHTVTNGNLRQTFETPMTEAEFKTLWDQVSKIDDLRAYLRSAPYEPLSVTDHVIVRIFESTYGGNDYQVYWIPLDCKSKAVLAWLQAIENCSDQVVR